jgi:hypothetical protein
MNRAWIPAGALASVSVAGLIALGPLTDSLGTKVSFPNVVTVPVPAAKTALVPVSYAGGVVGNTTHASLTRGGAARPSAPTNSDIGQVSVQVAKKAPTVAHSTVPRASTPTTPVKKKNPKRPTSIGGSSASNGDVGLASGGSSGSGGGGEQKATPAADPNP